MKFVIKTLLVNIAILVIIFIGINVAHPNTTPEQDIELSEMFGEMIVTLSPIIWGVAIGKALGTKWKNRAAN